MRLLIGCFLIATLTLTACKKSSDSEEVTNDSLANLGDTVQAAVGSLATSSESGTIGSFAFDQNAGENSPLATCSQALRSGCSASGLQTIDYNSCTITAASGAIYTLSGGWSDAFDSQATCNATPPRTSGSVTRTSSAAVVQFPGGATVTTDTAAHTTYTGATIPAAGITTTFGAGTRAVQINGLHRILRGPRGLKWFDHTLTTSAALSISGTRALGTRAIASGSVTLYHNIAQYTATNAINNLTWGNANCCYPTSGSISSVLSGGVSGTVTMSFTSTCGQAYYTDTAQRSSTVTLTQCE